ncbi:UNVERIFIED_ORG: hypothetical protein M2348_001084 [Sphingomonas sp. R1F5B]
MTVQSDLGPTAPARWRVYNAARQIAALSQSAIELATEGPQCDVPRALAQLDRVRAMIMDLRREGQG